jgi:hypothetical protein
VYAESIIIMRQLWDTIVMRQLWGTQYNAAAMGAPLQCGRYGGTIIMRQLWGHHCNAAAMISLRRLNVLPQICSHPLAAAEIT